MGKSIRPKVCVVSTTPLSVHFFLKPHIEGLSIFADVILVTNVESDSYTPPLDLPVRMVSIGIKREISLWADIRTLVGLVDMFRKERFDLVWAVGPKAGLLGILAAWFTGVRVRLFIFQGEVWASRKGFWRWVLKSADKIIVRGATNLLAVSHSERDFLNAEGVVSADKVEVLGVGSIKGVDLSIYCSDKESRVRTRKELGVPSDATVVLFVGRLNADKGVFDLAHAFRDAAQCVRNLWLVVVGPDEESAVLKMRSLLGERYSQCIFVGFSSRPDKYMAASDMLCLPSYREGFPVSILEAAAVGIPAIGSSIYGISDAIVDEQTGVLVEVGNPKDLSSAIVRLAESSEFCRRLGDAAHLRVAKEFPTQTVVRRYVDYFKRCLDA